MLFNSLDFLVFFGVFFPVYWVLPGDLRRKSLILASMLFYAWWNYLYLFHFVAMVLFSYFCYVKVRNDKSNFFFYLGLATNLANLVFFKYVSTTLLWIGESTGTAYLIHAGQALHFGFPLPISFYP